MEFQVAFAATESRTFAVPLVSMPTVRALLRCVSSIYEENVLSNSFSLILDKLLKLMERPAIEFPVELLAFALPDSDLTQILESKYSVFRADNLLRDAMVYISRKPSLATGKLLKLAFGRRSAFGLQLLTKIGNFSTPILDFLRVEEPIIRADCNIDYSAIYSKNFEITDILRIGMFQGYMQVKHFVAVIAGYSGGLDGPAKIISAARWNAERCFDSSLCGSNSSNAMQKTNRNDSLVISHSGERFSLWKSLASNCFQSLASTISGSLYQRGRKIRKALTDKLVGSIMIFNLVPGFVLKSPFCRDRERFDVCPHRIKKSIAILFGQPELESNRPKHIHI